MKFLEKDTVVRYLVEFDDQETATLQERDLLPEYVTVPARLYLTFAEAVRMLEAIHGKAAAADFVAMLEQQRLRFS